MDWINSLGNYVPCPICGHLHDDGAFILTETGHNYFICFDCDEKYPGKAAREVLEKMEKDADNGKKTFK